MGFVDLHSHVLPALDDGAKTMADALDMLRGLAEVGFEVVHATPHQRAGFFVPSAESIESACAAVRGELGGRGPVVRLGAENMWDEIFLERSVTRAVPGYRDPVAEAKPAAFLFELPVAHLPPRLEEHLFQTRCAGLLPVMAHPERYAPLWDDLARLEALSQRAALVVDLAALDGAHGGKQAKAARRIVEAGLAHACASDVHTPSDVRAAAAGITWIRKRMGERAVARLLDSGPRQILNGELPS